MKYKLEVRKPADHIVVCIPNPHREHSILLIIYDTYNARYPSHFWPDEFWFSPDWPGGADPETNREYHLHREEYIAEAKKLLVKEML